MNVVARLNIIKERIAQACAHAGRNVAEIRIVAVTKTATESQIMELIGAGHLDLGENRVQVLESHAVVTAQTPGVRWHMIGHLQRNKVRDVLMLVHTIESVDSVRLAREIEKEAAKLERRIPVLVQVNAGAEQQKFGVAMEGVLELAQQMAEMPHLELQGMMSMAPLTEDTELVAEAFARTRDAFEKVRSAGFAGEGFRELSMGMSGDFELAIAHGATMLRIGSALFGTTA